MVSLEDRLKQQIGELIFINHALAMQLEEANEKLQKEVDETKL